MPPVGFETTISAGERPQTYALNRVTTGTGDFNEYLTFIETSNKKGQTQTLNMLKRH